jgi:hexosaminidase
VLQWWGISTNLDRLVGRPNEVILSSYDFAYLDKGFGNRNGIDYGNYIKWRDIYAFNPRLEGVNVIGGEACMWSELSSPSTHHQKIWNRASIIAERLWNNNVSIKDDIRNIAERLVAQSRRMQ